jgi:predicted aldo/keto reductase-like oxidoreductase
MRQLDRREFLRGSAAAGVGLGLAPLAGAAGAGVQAARVRRKVRLGRTELQVSDIGFGSSRLSGDTDLVRHALDRGISYFDTAEGYTNGESEKTLGRALDGVRDQVVIASKGMLGAGDDRKEMMRALDDSLRRLRTDRIDVYFMHAVNNPKRIRNPEWPEFLAQAKQQGKIRFSGMSGHGGRLVECVDAALDGDLVDVLLLGYNFGQDPSFVQKFTGSFDFVAIQPDLPRALAKARKQDVGVVAMKTLRGARLNDMRPYETEGGTFSQAAFRWVLSNENVDSLIVTMRSREQVDEYLVASGSGAPSAADESLLERYEQANGETQCRYGCDACENACPEGVPIAEVLRTRMYAEDYGDAPLARGEYTALGAGASACISCSHQACSGACPFGLQIPELTKRTHGLLSGKLR